MLEPLDKHVLLGYTVSSENVCVFPYYGSKTISRKDEMKIQQNITKEYLAGFVDGEGCFYIGVVPAPETKFRWQVIHFFKVSQNPKGKIVLDTLKKTLRSGSIRSNHSDSDDSSLAYVVRDLTSLDEKVIPFFKDTLVIKKQECAKFARVIELVKHKKHLTLSGLKEILDIAYSMNTHKRKWTQEYILNDIASRIPTDYTPDTYTVSS